MNKKWLIVIVGPTAIGKTALGIELAKHFLTEIISSDSRQFFKEMSIGTAVPSADELSRAKHHFVQHRSIFEPYSVGDFEREAIEKLRELFKKRDVVVMVGGSGLYVDAVLRGLDYFPDVPPSIRKTLNKEYEANGIEKLQQQLEKLDPEYHKRVDLGNAHRLIRALEICIGTGQPYSSFLTSSKKTRSFTPIKIGLTADRAIIYERINQRVDIMMQQGQLEEAKGLYQHKELNALQTVGYRELFKYFDKEWELDFAISEIKKNTRRFAKRQLTWFRKDKEIEWTEFPIRTQEVINHIENSFLAR